MTIEPLKQRKNECWVTSLAMLTKKSVDELLEEFKEIAGVGYHDAIDSATRTRNLVFQDLTWFDTVNIMLRKYGFQAQPGCKLANTVLATPPPTGDRKVYLTAKLLSGKGILAIAPRKGVGHAVAFENGVIVDPNLQQGPMPYKQWKAIYGRSICTWRIDRCS